MPRTAIPVTSVTRAGVVPPSATAGDATNDHTIAGNDGQVWLEAENTDTVARDITIVATGSVDGLAVADRVVNVVNGAANKKLIGPFPPAVYNEPDGSISIDVAQSTWNLRAFRLS